MKLLIGTYGFHGLVYHLSKGHCVHNQTLPSYVVGILWVSDIRSNALHQGLSILLALGNTSGL